MVIIFIFDLYLFKLTEILKTLNSKYSKNRITFFVGVYNFYGKLPKGTWNMN